MNRPNTVFIFFIPMMNLTIKNMSKPCLFKKVY